MGGPFCIPDMHDPAIDHFRVATIGDGQHMVEQRRPWCDECAGRVAYLIAVLGWSAFRVCELFGYLVVDTVRGGLRMDLCELLNATKV